jgi:hypothetical protein
MTTEWHFPIMIAASLLIFCLIVRLVIPKAIFHAQRNKIAVLATIVVVFGMLFGKYGATMNLPWWLYYPIPMFATLLLPPVVLKFNARQTIIYIIFSFISAPFIHAFFSFFLGWTEYMPFWKIPFVGDLL